MAKFIQGFDLNTCIENIFREAKKQLWIISPYIKLHLRYKDCLRNHLEKDRLEIIVVFGKNEGDIQKSLPKEEVEFLARFPNIEIRYEKRLHAKYYANDTSSLLTSMNLYDFSQDNNIEAGILMEMASLISFPGGGNLDAKAYEYFGEVIENSELMFKNEPQYISGIMGLSKRYEKSIVTENKIENLIKLQKVKIEQKSLMKGVCIRCGTEIELKPTVPYCRKCYAEWKKSGNLNQKEKYCHICGDSIPSTINYPVCRSCYRKEKEKLEFPATKK